MKREGLRRAVAKAIVMLVFFTVAISPFTAISSVAAAERRYVCVWADGTASRESYAEVFPSLAGISRDGAVLLERAGVRGETRADGVKELCASLFAGELSDLLQIDGNGCDGLGLAALWQEFGGVLWHDGIDAFRWTGRKIERTKKLDCDKVVLLSGKLPATFLKRSQATELELRTGAEFAAPMLTGSNIRTITAEAPYTSAGGAVYLTVPSGVRFVAAVPTARTLVVEGNWFCDEGALLPCELLEEITLPFIGNMASEKGTEFRGEFAVLFSDGEEYRIPARLKKVTVTGGVLVSHAFYRCAGIEEINACGVFEEKIARDAFVDLASLKVLHTPRRNVDLPNGSFTATSTACGCTIYRSGEV